MNSRPVSILSALGFLFGHIFMWSNNSNMFTNKALFVSLLLVIILSITIYFANNFLFSKVIFPGLKRIATEKIRIMVFSFISSLVVIITSWCIIDYNIYFQNIVLAPILMIIIFCLFGLGKEKIMLVFIIVMLVFSSINLSLREKAQYAEQKKLEAHSLYDNNIHHINFKNKPNIYLIWLESYNDLDILKNNHKIDVSGLEDFLEENNFFIKEKTYSSAFYTLMAFAQLYTCGYYDNNNLINVNQEIARGSLDVSKNIRKIIGGDNNNIILKILKYNNYKTFMITNRDHYYTSTQGEYLDEIDLPISKIKIQKKYSFFYKYLLPVIRFSIFYKYIDNYLKRDNINDIYNGGLYERVVTAIHRGKKSGQPYFITFKLGANHTSIDYKYSKKNRIDWINNVYKCLIDSANIELFKLLTYIISNDNNSLIIILGDHGPWTYREKGYYLPTAYPQDNVSTLDIFDDIFRVLFAYRLPDGAQDDISHGMYMNNTNIFMHIFAYLAEDTTILKYRMPSISQHGDIKMVEGKLVAPE